MKIEAKNKVYVVNCKKFMFFRVIFDTAGIVPHRIAVKKEYKTAFVEFFIKKIN